MANVALVTGADRGLGRALAEALLERGWTVLAGQHLEWPELDTLASRFPNQLHLLRLDVGSDESVRQAALCAAEQVPAIDLVIANAAINRSHNVASLRQQPSFDDMKDEFNVNALGALRTACAFMPLLERSAMKRLCFVSSEAGSIGASQRTGWFGYCMSKAALNMAVKNLWNDLAPQGFSFRLYHPGWVRTYMQGTKNLNADMEPEEAAEFALRHFLSPDEPEELVLVDWEGKRWPW